MGEHSHPQALKCTWSSVVKLGQSLYREKPGQDKFRPGQATPVENFFLAGSYTYQDYIDSMEGATKSGATVLACFQVPMRTGEQSRNLTSKVTPRICANAFRFLSQGSWRPMRLSLALIFSLNFPKRLAARWRPQPE